MLDNDGNEGNEGANNYWFTRMPNTMELALSLRSPQSLSEPFLTWGNGFSMLQGGYSSHA